MKLVHLIEENMEEETKHYKTEGFFDKWAWQCVTWHYPW